MNARKYAHRHVPRVVADEHFIDLENRSQLSIQGFRRQMGQIQKYLVFAVYPHSVKTHLEDLASGNIARDQITVSRIPLFKEVESLVFRDRSRGALIALCLGHPDAATLATRGFRHQPQFIFARYGRWVDL